MATYAAKLLSCLIQRFAKYFCNLRRNLFKLSTIISKSTTRAIRALRLSEDGGERSDSSYEIMCLSCFIIFLVPCGVLLVLSSKSCLRGDNRPFNFSVHRKHTLLVTPPLFILPRGNCSVDSTNLHLAQSAKDAMANKDPDIFFFS